MRRISLNLLLLALCGLVFSSCKKEGVRPNIILIMADDMGYECLGCNGSTEYQTPNIDRLASEGVKFTHCISQPLCTPSRVKIMTGKYNYRNYCDFGYLDVNEKTFGNYLKEAGYKTAIAGKWQLNGLETKRPGNQDRMRPQHFGFDEYCLWQLTHRRHDGERYASPLIEQNGLKLRGTEQKYGPDIFADFVVDFIEKNTENPFFVYYPMVLVHDPFVPTPDSESWKNPELHYKNDTTYFADMVSYTDKIVGRIQAALKKHKLTENTLVIFTGDNGTHWTIFSNTENGVIQGGKGRMHNRGTRVPMVASWPAKGVNEKTFTDLIDFSDFLPTLLEAAGVEVPEDIDGRSFLNVLVGKKFQAKETVTVHYDHMRTRQTKKFMGRFVRTKDYKLYHDGRFFDLNYDPNEKHPLLDIELTPEETNVKMKLQSIQDDAPEWPYSTEEMK